CYLAFLILFVPAVRAESPAKTVLDTWNTAYLENAKAGYVHTTIREFERDGKKFIRASTELKLNMLRNGRAISVRMETGDEETVDGKILAVFMRQFQGEEVIVHMRGEV